MTSETPERSGFVEQLAGYRHLREDIERNVLPMATSVDGTTFEFQASLHDLQIRRAGYVELDVGGPGALGQVTELRMAALEAHESAAGGVSNIRVRLAQGTGVVLDGDGAPFHDAPVRPATSDEVGSWQERTRPARAGLSIGELQLAPGVPAILDSGGLGRHTFMCGQSGSGKTYSLGLLLERVLAETSLRVIILDPNSDYVGLPDMREEAAPEVAARYEAVRSGVALWRDDPEAAHRLRLRFADLEPASRAAALDLDPVRDRDEYAVIVNLLHRQETGRPLVVDIDQLLADETPGAHELGVRAMNLGVLDWKVWGPDSPSLVSELRSPTSRCTVVDLGSLDTVREQRLVAEAVLSTLWDTRSSREPCLVVIDEAHNVCPAEPTDRLTALATERVVQIAAEGRKYGLYLLCSTQRPHKVHEDVVSQCDNLLLMRMNSQADVADLSRLFSFVPPGLMSGATSFRMGQALVAGKIMPQPAYVQMGERVSREGGSDVPATWADPRPD